MEQEAPLQGGAILLQRKENKMALYRLKADYHNELENADDEFMANVNRAHYIVTKLNYKGEKITVAIPLRSNINEQFQKNPDEYVVTPPSSNTETQKGNVAGWHILKMIPINSSDVYANRHLSEDLQIAEDTIKENKQEFFDKVKKMLKRFENGERVFGAIDFDAALERLKLRQQQREQAKQNNANNVVATVSSEIDTKSIVAPTLSEADKAVITKIRGCQMFESTFDRLMERPEVDEKRKANATVQLLNILAFFSGKDKATMGRIFKTSKLYDGDENKLSATIDSFLQGFGTGAGSGSRAGTGASKGPGKDNDNYL